MKVSVIIPTYNGKHRITNLLATIGKQTIKTVEVIVVIDGSTDGTKEYLQQTDFGFTYEVYVQENKGRAAVRNKGSELATGDLLIFFDDDMRLEPNCIEEHILHHRKNPISILTGAQIDDFRTAMTDFHSYKCLLSRAWVKKLQKKQGHPQQFPEIHITAANFSISKELFNKVGRFNELLNDCEDYDFGLRAYWLNIPIFYSEKAFGWHDDFPSAVSFVKRQLDYKAYNDILYRKYPTQFKHLEKSRLKQPGKIAKVFFSLFMSEKWIKAIDKNCFLFLPRFLRYKLYSYIITAHSTYKEYL